MRVYVEGRGPEPHTIREIAYEQLSGASPNVIAFIVAKLITALVMKEVLTLTEASHILNVPKLTKVIERKNIK